MKCANAFERLSILVTASPDSDFNKYAVATPGNLVIVVSNAQVWALQVNITWSHVALAGTLTA
jgi:hypothetical protein